MTDLKTVYLTDVHAYRWPDGMEVVLEEFKTGSDSFSALMTVMHRIESTNDEPTLLYGPARINLTAPTTVASTAKALSFEKPHVEQDAWKERLKHIVYHSRTAYQEGGSVLRHADEIELDRSVSPSLLHPLIAGAGVTLWYADSSAGKTMVAEAAGLTVVTGFPFLGVTPSVTGPVIYYDWEDNEQTFRERVEALCAGADVPVPHDFIYRSPDRSVSSGEARIRRECEEEKAVLAIFDSVGEMLGGDPSDPVLVIPAVNVLKRIGCPALGLHHISAQQAASKDLADKQKGYGSVYIRSGARLQWFFDRFQEEEADEGYLYAHNTKVNRGKKSKPLSWMVEYENGADAYLARLRYSTRSAGDYFDRLREETPAADKTVSDTLIDIFRSYRGAAAPLDTLVEKVSRIKGSVSEQTVRNKLGALVKKGTLVSFTGESGRVVWALASERSDDF
jgi:hypothetical protein